MFGVSAHYASTVRSRSRRDLLLMGESLLATVVCPEVFGSLVPIFFFLQLYMS
jgi:hypothetical protein